MGSRLYIVCLFLGLLLQPTASKKPLRLWRILSDEVREKILAGQTPDADNDGIIDNQEALNFLQLEGEDLDDFLVYCDQNGDGNSVVELTEFQVGVLFLSGTWYMCNEGKKTCEEKRNAKTSRKNEL